MEYPNNPQNPNYNTQNSANGSPSNYNSPQNPQYAQNPPRQGAVTTNEMFVGLNILSKIGVIFIIIGVIAFSATSGDYLSAGVRMAMVIVLGIIMLGAGELFFRKGSKVFANALIYGGIAELFVCSLIGANGFKVFNDIGAIVTGLCAVIAGMLLTLRYKSQGLLIVTIIFSILPVFADNASTAGTFLMPLFYMIVNCAAAIISRKKYYTASSVVGICAVTIEAILVRILIGDLANELNWDWTFTDNIFLIVPTVFILCSAFCWSSGPLLNAIQSDGRFTAAEAAVLCTVQGFAIVYTDIFLHDAGAAVSKITIAVLAVIFAVTAAAFALRFGIKCGAVTVFSNLALAAITWALLTIEHAAVARNIAFHIFAAAVLIFGVIIGRRMFKIWGYTLLGMSELLFLGVLMSRRGLSEKFLPIIINLVLWFGLMIFFILKKQTENNLFKAYACMTFLNAGILGSNLISAHLTAALIDLDIWQDGTGKSAFSALLCAVLWMLLGFAVGKMKYLKTWGHVSLFSFYGIGLLCLFWANIANSVSRLRSGDIQAVMVIITIVVNAASVISVLDMTLQIQGKAPKFAKAVGLVVSAYAMVSLTTMLGTNDFVKFTSCIISIIYIVTAAAWIVIGFWKYNALLRRFGLALALLSSAKLFLFDFSGVDAMGKTLLFIGFGITLLAISFGYGIAEKQLKQREKR